MYSVYDGMAYISEKINVTFVDVVFNLPYRSENVTFVDVVFNLPYRSAVTFADVWMYCSENVTFADVTWY